MIKRRFYRADRGDRDDASSSSSSSDSEAESRSSEDSENEEPHMDSEPELDSNVEAGSDTDNDDDIGRSASKMQCPSSSSSGYESEDSSGNEIDVQSAGLFANVDDSKSGKDGGQLNGSLFSKKKNGKLIETEAKDQDHPAIDDLPKCVLKCKTVYKCRLCPKIVCLNEDSLKTHLKSKRHSRSEKLLNNGKLKRILNSDGEEEVISDDDCETHAERHARIVALAQETTKTKNKGLGRQRQRLRLKRKKQGNSANIPISGQQKENRAKRRRKNVD